MERPGGRGTWRQSQLPFATVRQGRRDQSPDFGAVAVAEMSEGEVVFPSDSGSSAESSQIIVPATPSESPESPYYRHDSQAAQRQPSTPSPSQPRQLTPEEIAYFQAQEQWQQERLQRQRQADMDQRSFQAGLRSERAFHEGELPITHTAPGRSPNQLDYSIPYQTPEYSWQHRMGITQQQQRDIDEQRAAIARAETAAIEQRQQIRETRQEELDRLADEARQRDRDRRQGGGGSGSRRKSAITASRRKKIKQSKSKRKSKYTRKSNKNKMQRKKSQRRN